MQNRTIAYLIFATAIFTGMWIILAVINTGSISPATSLEQKIFLLTHPGILFYLIYINATLITVSTVAMYAGFYYHCRQFNAIWAIIAMVFVPMYGIGNLITYLSQVFIVPKLVSMHSIAEFELISKVLLGQMLQDWPGSAMASLNGVSYAILGITSIIFAIIWIKNVNGLRAGALLLAISGLFSIFAVVGIAAENSVISFFLVISGFIYFIALLLIGFYFIRR